MKFCLVLTFRIGDRVINQVRSRILYGIFSVFQDCCADFLFAIRATEQNLYWAGSGSGYPDSDDLHTAQSSPDLDWEKIVEFRFTTLLYREHSTVIYKKI
jgi:hypothetical protein